MLSTSVGGGGGGAGGIAMAYRAPPGQGASSGPSAAPKISSAPMVSNAALAADQTKKDLQAADLSIYPLVSIDFESSGGDAVAYAPPGGVAMPVPLADAAPVGSARAYVGTNGTDLVFDAGGAAAYKSLKRMLLRGGPGNVGKTATASLAHSGSVRLSRPHEYLGARRLADAATGATGVGDIAPEGGTVDGSSPCGDDDDRVVYPLGTLAPPVAEGKKKRDLTMLPDEAVGLAIAAAKRAVHEQVTESDTMLQKKFGKKATAAKLEDEFDVTDDLPYAVATAVAGYRLNDFYVEGLREAIAYSGSNVDEELIYHRCTAAFVGAFLMRLKKDPTKAKSGDWDGLIRTTMGEVKRLAGAGGQQKSSKCRSEQEQPVVLTVGLTPSGYDLHFLQVGDMSGGIFPFGSVGSIAASCAVSPNATEDFDAALTALIPTFVRAAPNRRPCLVLAYGSANDQAKAIDLLGKNKALQGLWASSKNSGGATPPLFTSATNVVSVGTAALAAGTEGRLPGDPVTERPAATWAVGIRLDFFGDGKPGVVRQVFEFGRRLPASYDVEVSAAECAAARERGGNCQIPEEDDDDVKKMGASKSIPKREEAALALQFQIVQKVRHGDGKDGDWVPVGGALRPLVYMEVKEKADGSETEGEEIGRENAVLNISVNTLGLITTKMGGDRQSVVQSTRTARSDKIKYYIGLLACILFFGGFAVKSYWDEYVLNRDAHRLLTYYKFVTPDKLGADNLRNARYTVYRYRADLDRLWRRLHLRYGVKVPERDWDNEESYVKTEEDEELVNLDTDEKDSLDDEAPPESGDEEGEL